MKVLVIGGGMAGLTYAIVACKNGYDVTVAERNSRVGKKVAMTGNGKCNIGNLKVTPACYNKSNVVKRVLSEITVAEYRRFLTSCGIFTYSDSEGRLYPLTDSASSVVDCLRYQVVKFGGKLLCDCEVTTVTRSNCGYQVNLGGSSVYFDKVVLACGSGSQADTPNVYGIVPSEMFTPRVPSLVPVKIRNMDAILNGIRARADVTLYDGNVLLGKESGEILFKDYGFSGICVFNLSALIARKQAHKRQGNYVFIVDVVPYLQEWDLQEILRRRVAVGERDKLFYGVIRNKLAECIVKRVGNTTDVTRLAYTAKNLQFEFDKLLDSSMSQVTAGGIDERYVNLDTLTTPNGVVALGEVLDVDGVCGGNNLYFAAASALYAFSSDERNRAYSVS